MIRYHAIAYDDASPEATPLYDATVAAAQPKVIMGFDVALDSAMQPGMVMLIAHDGDDRMVFPNVRLQEQQFQKPFGPTSLSFTVEHLNADVMSTLLGDALDRRAM